VNGHRPVTIGLITVVWPGACTVAPMIYEPAGGSASSSRCCSATRWAGTSPCSTRSPRWRAAAYVRIIPDPYLPRRPGWCGPAWSPKWPDRGAIRTRMRQTQPWFPLQLFGASAPDTGTPGAVAQVSRRTPDVGAGSGPVPRCDDRRSRSVQWRRWWAEDLDAVVEADVGDPARVDRDGLGQGRGCRLDPQRRDHPIEPGCPYA
jgi:hypothetical protein